MEIKKVKAHFHDAKRQKIVEHDVKMEDWRMRLVEFAPDDIDRVAIRHEFTECTDEGCPVADKHGYFDRKHLSPQQQAVLLHKENVMSDHKRRYFQIKGIVEEKSPQS